MKKSSNRQNVFASFFCCQCLDCLASIGRSLGGGGCCSSLLNALNQAALAECQSCNIKLSWRDSCTFITAYLVNATCSVLGRQSPSLESWSQNQCYRPLTSAARPMVFLASTGSLGLTGWLVKRSWPLLSAWELGRGNASTRP
jgi:hypothetical protein